MTPQFIVEKNLNGQNDFRLDLVTDKMPCDLTRGFQEITCDLTWTCKIRLVNDSC
jgi:hypothetical protein